MASPEAQRRYEEAVKRWAMRQQGKPASAIGVVSFWLTYTDCELCGDEVVTVNARFSCRNSEGRVRTYDRALEHEPVTDFITALFEDSP